MKYHWEPKDVVCGRIVCKPNPYKDGFKPCGWTAKWTFKIGWLACGNPKEKIDYTNKQTVLDSRCDYCTVAMTDGMIGAPQTKQQMAEWLNREEMIPMPQEWFLDTIVHLRHLNENGNTF